MGRCVSPCLGDLDPNAYRRRLDEALGLFDGPDGPERLLARFDEEMERASAEQKYERAAVLRDRRERIAELLSRLGGLVRAVHSGRARCAGETPGQARMGPLLDRGRPRGRMGRAKRPAARPREEAERLASSPANPPVVAPDEVHEVRIVSSWLAGDEAWECELEPGTDVAGWVEQVVAA